MFQLDGCVIMNPCSVAGSIVERKFECVGVVSGLNFDRYILGKE